LHNITTGASFSGASSGELRCKTSPELSGEALRSFYRAPELLRSELLELRSSGALESSIATEQNQAPELQRSSREAQEKLQDRDFQNQGEEQDFNSHAQVIPTETK
jgi:hypothetical protein